MLSDAEHDGIGALFEQAHAMLNQLEGEYRAAFGKKSEEINVLKSEILTLNEIRPWVSGNELQEQLVGPVTNSEPTKIRQPGKVQIGATVAHVICEGSTQTKTVDVVEHVDDSIRFFPADPAKSAEGSGSMGKAANRWSSETSTFTPPLPRVVEDLGDDQPAEASDRAPPDADEEPVDSPRLLARQQSPASRDSETSPDMTALQKPRAQKAFTKASILADGALNWKETENTRCYMDDMWSELHFMNTKEGEDHLEKIYRERRLSEREYEDPVERRGPRRSQNSSGSNMSSEPTSSHEIIHKVSQVQSEVSSLCTRLQGVVLLPHSRLRSNWDIGGIAILIWDILYLPIETAWDLVHPAGSVLNVIFYVTLCYWSLDIILTFFTATYTSTGEVTTSLSDIAKKYARSWLSFDLSIVTLDWLLAFSNDAAFRSVRLLRSARMIRLLRLLKLNKFSRKVEDNLVAQGRQGLILVISLAKIAMEMLGLLHFLSCLLWFIGRVSQENPNTFGKNWIDRYEASRLSTVHQYMKCFNWMFAQFSPTPFPYVTQNELEQAVLLFVIVFSLPVFGSSLSRLTGLVTQMNARASERARTQRQLELYLMVNKFPVELSSRIYHFIEHKLKQSSTKVTRPDVLSLLPSEMARELTMAQMGETLTKHPLLNLIQEAKLDVISAICEVFHMQSFLPEADVFVAGSISTNMYITAQGTYDSYCKEKKHVVTEIARLGLSSFSDSKWFAELHLFTPRYAHTITLSAITFGEAFKLAGGGFMDTIKSSPVAIVAAYEYAKALLTKLNKEARAVKDYLPLDMCLSSCASTQLSEIMFPGGAGGDLPPEVVVEHHVESSPMEEFISGLLHGNNVDTETLQDMFPELHETGGAYTVLDHMDERSRCMLAVLSATWLAGNDYDAMTFSQKDATKRLQPSTWDRLQRFVKWVDLDEDMFHATLVLLTIRGLGKSKELKRLCPPHARKYPECITAYVMEAMQNLVPSVELLTERARELVRAALFLQTEFNFPQFIQGENIPYNVALLEDIISDQGEELLRFYLFTMVCIMSGLTGTVTLEGSIFMNELNATSLLCGLHYLREVGNLEPELLYWSYIGKRAKTLAVKHKSQVELTFARLMCMTRSVDKKGLAILEDAWKQLKSDEKHCLMKCFTANGIEDQAFIFMFLPDYFTKAISNTRLGLHCALICFLDLFDRLQDCMDKVHAMVYIVNIADLAGIVADVKTPQGLKECIKQLKVVQKDDNVSVVITAKCRQAAAQVTWRQDNTAEASRNNVSAEAFKDITDRLDRLGTQMTSIARDVKGLNDNEFWC